MARAAGVVAMGGYNTFCEILSFDKPALIVPRTAPRLEQYIRAQRAAELGLVTMLSDDERARSRYDGGGAAAADAAGAALGGGRARACSTACRTSTGWRANGSTADAIRGSRTPGCGATHEPAPSPAGGRVAFVLKGYPRLSETFIAQEILALEQRGLDILIVSLRHPTDRRSPSGASPDPRRRCSTCPNICTRSRCACWRGWRRARRLPGYRAARRAWLADLRRDPTPNRIRRFGQALVLAAELPAGCRSAACAFPAHPGLGGALCGADARAAVERLGACQGHLDDPGLGKAREARRRRDWAVTCTASGARASRRAGAEPGTGGAVLSRARPRPLSAGAARDGATPTAAIRRSPVVLLSVGRAVAKKGYDDLLAALALLPAALAWRLVHIGGGALAGG